MEWAVLRHYLAGSGAVALLNWCVRVFSKKFKTIETTLAVEESAELDVQPSSKTYKISDLMKHRNILLSIVLLTIFYLFWNLPANTWGSFVNYFLVTVDNRSQAFSTVIALIANIACLFSTFFYFKVSDTKYRYPVMYGGLLVGLIAFVTAGTFSDYWQAFTIAYICYSASNILWGEALYKIWTQTFYPVDARASLTGFSYGIVRALTAVFSLVTPTLMAFSPKLLLWIMAGCTLVSGLCAIIIVKHMSKFKMTVSALEKE